MRYVLQNQCLSLRSTLIIFYVTGEIILTSYNNIISLLPLIHLKEQNHVRLCINFGQLWNSWSKYGVYSFVLFVPNKTSSIPHKQLDPCTRVGKTRYIDGSDMQGVDWDLVESRTYNNNEEGE